MKIVKTYKEVTIAIEPCSDNRYMMFIKESKDKYVGVGTLSEDDTKYGLRTNYLYDLETANRLFNVIKLTSGIFFLTRDNKLVYYGNVVTYKKITLKSMSRVIYEG